MKDTYKTIGKNILRIGAVERLKGEPIFSADLGPALAAKERNNDGEEDQFPIFFQITQRIIQLCR